jgi:hypothetical protein
MKYNDETSALQDIKKGNLWAYISIPANYSYFVVERATSELYASDETFDGSRITFEMDMSSKSSHIVGSFLVSKVLANTVCMF